MKKFQKPKKNLYVGNSGTTIRLLSGILAAQDFECTITGDESIQKRPMKRVIDPLCLMGAEILSQNGNAPLTIKGRNLKGVEYEMPVASAQVKSAIILAGLFAQNTTVIHESVKTRDHTEIMLQAMGANVTTNGLTVTVKKTQHLTPIKEINIPADISGAAFLITAALILPNSSIIVPNVGINPTRTGILDALIAMGAKIEITNKKSVCGELVGDIHAQTSNLRAIEIGGEIIPRMIDEIPIFAVAAAFASGVTVVSGAEELRVKESDRIETVTQEFSKMGVIITAKPDGFVVNGKKEMNTEKFCVKSHGDHRIAMSLAILALAQNCPTEIEGASCADVSFPGFWRYIL